MPAIDILMAAYNGERFIREQIDSILNQTFQDFRLVIRDDGSSDNTPAIIEEYAEKYPSKIKIIHDDVVCKGATKNFFELLKHAEADYVMFSDQDDFWLPYKVQITFDYMKNAERENPGKPVMVFTGLQVVDAELKSLDTLMGINFSEKRYCLKELLACNCASGCTQMLNRTLYEGIGGYDEDITLHDWWTTLYAAVFGVIVRVPMALILYRQHGGNAIGSTIMWHYIGIPARLKQYFKHPFAEASAVNYVRRAPIQLFRSRFLKSISPEKLREIDDYLDLFSKNIFKRFKAVKKFKDVYFFNLHKLISLRLLFLGDK